MEFKILGDLVVPESQKYILDIVRPHINGPWIAGGAIRQWMLGQEVKSDFDIYMEHISREKTLNTLITQYKKRHYEKWLGTENAITYRELKERHPVATHPSEFAPVLIASEHIEGAPLIQIIKKQVFKTPREVVESFDFAQIQLITDGVKVYGNPNWDSTELQIETFKSDSILKRYIKYQSYGYTLPEGTLSSWADIQDLNYDHTNNDY